MADDLGERTEAPTGKRLAEAREKGQIPKSQDLAGAATLFGSLLILILFGGMIGTTLAGLLRAMLITDAAGGDLSVHAMAAATRRAFGIAGLALLPVLALAAVLGFLTQFVQVGWNVSAEPVRPKLDKLDPLKGFKRIFGKRGLVKTGLDSLKLATVLGVGWMVATSHARTIAALPALTAAGALAEAARILLTLALVLIAMLIAIGLIDLAYQRWQHTRDLRMTRQQVKDERRTMEGDPQIKGKRIQMARQIAMQRVGKAVPEADVIVTNPTHFSVAIQYDPETMRAPKVTAKGADEIALRIRQIARQHDVPVIERPPLARALYWGVEVGREIPSEHYEAVAEILAYVYRLEERLPDRPRVTNARPRPRPATAGV